MSSFYAATSQSRMPTVDQSPHSLQITLRWIDNSLHIYGSTSSNFCNEYGWLGIEDLKPDRGNQYTLLPETFAHDLPRKTYEGPRLSQCIPGLTAYIEYWAARVPHTYQLVSQARNPKDETCALHKLFHQHILLQSLDEAAMDLESRALSPNCLTVSARFASTAAKKDKKILDAMHSLLEYDQQANSSLLLIARAKTHEPFVPYRDRLLSQWHRLGLEGAHIWPQENVNWAYGDVCSAQSNIVVYSTGGPGSSSTAIQAPDREMSSTQRMGDSGANHRSRKEKMVIKRAEKNHKIINDMLDVFGTFDNWAEAWRTENHPESYKGIKGYGSGGYDSTSTVAESAQHSQL